MKKPRLYAKPTGRGEVELIHCSQMRFVMTSSSTHRKNKQIKPSNLDARRHDVIHRTTSDEEETPFRKEGKEKRNGGRKKNNGIIVSIPSMPSIVTQEAQVR